MEISIVVDFLVSLSHVARLQILTLLLRGAADGIAAGEIAAQLGLPSATLSFHLKELMRSRLVSARRRGRNRFYTADPAAIRLVAAYLTGQLLGHDTEPGDTGREGKPKPAIRAKVSTT